MFAVFRRCSTTSIHSPRPGSSLTLVLRSVAFLQRLLNAPWLHTYIFTLLTAPTSRCSHLRLCWWSSAYAIPLSGLSTWRQSLKHSWVPTSCNTSVYWWTRRISNSLIDLTCHTCAAHPRCQCVSLQFAALLKKFPTLLQPYSTTRPCKTPHHTPLAASLRTLRSATSRLSAVSSPRLNLSPSCMLVYHGQALATGHLPFTL